MQGTHIQLYVTYMYYLLNVALTLDPQYASMVEEGNETHKTRLEEVREAEVRNSGEDLGSG